MKLQLLNSHSMTSLPGSLRPRKRPVQDRSIHTVEAIYVATVQVLVSVGLERLTTTRVAERAGVSVGTLYQYFPNKGALLAGALHRHLTDVVEEIERACQDAKGGSLEAMARGVVRAFFAAKTKDMPTSRALYGVASEVEGAVVVSQMARRAQLALCEMLATARDARFPDLSVVTFVWSTSMIGPVQSLLEIEAPVGFAAQVCQHLERMALSYLRGEASAAVAPHH